MSAFKRGADITKVTPPCPFMTDAVEKGLVISGEQ
jgi:hypothetical protein